jgi:multiple antibiotic resistance protein
MILGVELMKNDGPGGSATVVPLIFPLIAGAGTLTTLLSLRAEFHIENIIVAIILNMAFVYLVLTKLEWIEKIFGQGVIYVLRKFFGIILLAMAVKLFVTNISTLIG